VSPKLSVFPNLKLAFSTHSFAFVSISNIFVFNSSNLALFIISVPLYTDIPAIINKTIIVITKLANVIPLFLFFFISTILYFLLVLLYIFPLFFSIEFFNKLIHIFAFFSQKLHKSIVLYKNNRILY